MTRLAVASLRHRSTASVATFLTVLLGTALMGSFAGLAQASTGPVSSADRSTLVIMGAVVGGWGALIVLFAVASTVGITVTQRETEIGLLRTVGATPRQVRRLVRTETGLVALVAAIGGALIASVGGRVLLATIRSGGMVDDSVGYAGRFGPLAGPVGAALVVIMVALVGSSIAARRSTRGPASVVPSEARADGERMRRWRVVVAVLLIGYALVDGVITVTVTAHDSDPYAAMQTSGSCCILVALGLALLGPWLMRRLAPLVRPVLGGPTGFLAAYNTSRRASLLSGVLAPVIVLTSAAVGTLMLVATDGRTQPAGAKPDDTVNLLNNSVVGMIVVFAAVVVINTFAAVVAHRRAELHRLWLLGATPDQVERSVLAEAGIVAGIGVVLGTLAAMATIVPFGIARHEGVVPNGDLWLPPLIALGVIALTLGSARWAFRRAAPIRGGAAALR